MSNRKGKKSIIYLLVLLLTLGLTIGFSAFQNELFINDILLKVRLQRDVRVSESVISKSSGAVVNDQEYNKTKLLGNITFDSTSSYVLYKVDLTNYGNVKSGLLNISGDTGLNVSICDSNGSNCTNNLETPICNGSNCTLGATKEVYVKVSPTTSGTKNIDLDLDIQPYVNITYDNIRENTSSFKTEVLETSTYQITLTSKPETVEVLGDATVSYNKNTGVLTISEINSDLTIVAGYLINEIAETSYTGTNPNNYVRFNETLYRIITKENIDDGYGNTELRTKITSNDSIGENAFSSSYNEYDKSSIKNVLNNTYYNSLINGANEYIEEALWISKVYDEEGGIDTNTVYSSIAHFGLINVDDYTNNSSWLNKDQFTINPISSDTSSGVDSNYNQKYFKISPSQFRNDYQSKTMAKPATLNIYAISSGILNIISVDTLMDTYPTTYLKTNVLVVGGSGTSTDPYLLYLPIDGTQPNPTKISGKLVQVTGSNINLVNVTGTIGTPYYSLETPLNSTNYSTSGSTTIPSRSDVGNYTIYYYIPATGIYKAKTGSVTTNIYSLQFSINYQKGSNVSSIEKTSGSCRTTGSSLTCSVTLPEITPNNGYESVGWSLTNGDTAGVTGSYTLSSTNNNSTLYANAVVKHNYQNTTTLAYYGTLNDAFSAVSNNQTIKVLENVIETTNATLSNDKTGIKLDLNGKVITMSNTKIINNGGLDIYNTSSTDGKIDGGSREVVYNDGTLTLNNTSTTNKTIIDNTTIDQSNNRCIFNYIHGQITINDNAEIKTDISGRNGITLNGGHLTMTGGSIKTVSNGVSMGAGVIDIGGGSITSTSAEGLHCIGTTTITGGTITGYSSGVFSDGVLTLGTNDSNVNNTTPIIQATGTSNNYGLYNDDGDFYFYDGVIKSASGSGYAINSNPTNIPSGYKVQKTVSNGVESAYLEEDVITATFYYWNGTGISTVTSSCVTNGGSNCSVSIPTVVTNSTGKYGGSFNNVSDSLNSMSASSKYSGSSLVIDSDATFYATYKSNVTNHYYDGSQYTSRTLSRNEMFSTNNSVTVKLGLSAIAQENYTTETGPGNSVWAGLSTGQDTNVEYSSVDDAATSTSTTLYTVYTMNANFAYSSNINSISATSGSCKITTSNTLCSVNPPIVTVEDGYFARYWKESVTNNTLPINDPIILSENGRTYTVYADLCNYKNVNTSVCYIAAHNAFEDAEDNETIMMLNDREESYIVIDNSKQGLIFDMNGKNMSVVGNGFVNNGELTIEGNGTIISYYVESMIENNGTLILDNAGTIQNNSPATADYIPNPTAILNTGTLNIVGNENIIGTKSAIRSTAGYVNMENGNISVLSHNDMSAGISGSGNTNITVSGGHVSNDNNAYGSTIYWTSSGTLTITGDAQISSSSTNTSQLCYTIQNASTTGGTVVVSGGSITAGVGSDSALFLKGNSNTKLIITGGRIVSELRSIVNGTSGGESGSIEITGGIINSTESTALDSFGGTVNVTGGQLKSKNGCIIIRDGTLTLGTNDSSVSTTSPLVEATGYTLAPGVNINSGIFNFYDGVIKSSSGSGYAITKNPNNIPTGFQVRKELNNGVESAYLSKTVTATFYYNSNSTYDGLTISSTTASCGTDVNGSCTVTVPSAVTNSVGHYNAPYKSVSNQISNMNSSSLTISEDTNFYANYSAPVTIYYPTSTSARSSAVYYKNEYFMDNSETAPTEMASVIAVNNTTKTNMTFTPSVSGYSLYGFANNEGTNTRDFASVSALARTQQSSAYAIIRKSITATFYYNSNTTAGSLTVSTATSSGYQYIRCTSTAAEVSNGSISVPSEVSSSVGQYGSAYKGITSSTSNMTTANPTTANEVFYAAYSGNVTIYYPSSTTARSSTVYKRNEFFSSNSAMTAVLNTSNTATTNFTFSSAVSGYSLYGFANDASTNTRNYSSVSALAQSDKTTSYAVLRVGKTATVYYNSGSGNGTLSVSTATTNTAYQYLRCTSTAAEVSNSNYTIPTSVSESVGQYGNTYVNTAGAVNTMSASKSTAYTTLYAIYRDNNVTNYYYSSGAYTSRTLYRNNMFTSTTAMKTILNGSSGSISDYGTASGPGSSVWTGLSTGQDTTQEYNSVSAAANSTSKTLYTVYTFNVTYAKGSNVNSIGSTSGSCKVTTSSTSCNVTLPSITPKSGFVSTGWSTTNGASTGTSAGSSYSLNTNGRTLYANAKPTVYTVTHSHESQSDANYYITLTEWAPGGTFNISSIDITMRVTNITATWHGAPVAYVYAYNTATSNWDEFECKWSESCTLAGNSNNYSKLYVKYGGVSCDGSYRHEITATVYF